MFQFEKCRRNLAVYVEITDSDTASDLEVMTDSLSALMGSWTQNHGYFSCKAYLKLFFRFHVLNSTQVMCLYHAEFRVRNSVDDRVADGGRFGNQSRKDGHQRSDG